MAIGATVALASMLTPIVSEMRFKRARQPLTDDWSSAAIERRGSTLLGITFRPRQAEALGLNPGKCLETLLSYPFQLIRLGAYWNRMEAEPDRFVTDELDRQVEAAERAGKRIILCVGAVKTFGYPEFFVPAHHLGQPLKEGRLITTDEYSSLLSGATAFIARVVERYRDREAIVAWQVEHEAVDPLGMEHSWRLSESFVQAEVDTVRSLDPSRPVMMNGFVGTSGLVTLQQWWRTRDQGDSLAVAQRCGDIVGIDYYPRHALFGLGKKTVYLDGANGPWAKWRCGRILASASRQNRRVMICEGQAEPWETVTTPPNPTSGEGPPEVMFSCRPENLISNYNECMTWSRQASTPLQAYLFWGAEYWLLRKHQGDESYVRAFERILENA